MIYRKSNRHRTIYVRHFTTTPGARYDGPFSGKEFRETFLEPEFEKALDGGHTLFVNLDGTSGYASSFLDEAFGTLSTLYGADNVIKHISFICKDEPALIEDILEYINPDKPKNAWQKIKGLVYEVLFSRR